MGGATKVQSQVRWSDYDIFKGNATVRKTCCFYFRHMKDLGMGKSGMEPMIMEEAQKLIATFSKRIGKVTSLKLQLNVSILNAMWHIMTGEILEYDDPRCKEIIEKFYIMMARSNAVTPLLMWPWLRYIIPKQSGYTNTKEATERVTELIEESYDWHLKTFDTNNMRDFTDIYINEMMIHKDDANSTFNREDGKHNYIVVMTNMFVAGSETTSNTINYTLWYLCKYPEVQKKLQEEIDTVVGKDRVPTMNDKASLPYMEAVVHETQRIVGLAYNGIQRVAKRHVKLGGYDLPKGTRLGTALYEIMHDPTYWKDPEVYLPERFLKDGKFQPDERFVAFGIGKRNCMGKTLAQIELLLFLSAFIQRFNFRFPAGYDPATFKDEVGFILTCPDYPIIIDER